MRQGEYSADVPGYPSSPVTHVHPYVSPWRKWAVSSAVVTAIFSLTFSGLCAGTYKEFQRIVSAVPPTPDFPQDTWSSLFRGCAASAAFAFLLTVLTTVLWILAMGCARRSVAHPARAMSKSFVTAASLFTGLHILNIAIQFHSFQPLMSNFTNLGGAFNNRLLSACVLLGWLSGASYLVFALLLRMWVDKPGVFEVDNAPSAV